MRGDFWRRLGLSWLSPSDLEGEVDDELAFHMEMRQRELEADGMEPEEARRRVLRDFGDVDETRRRYVSRRGRDAWRHRTAGWMAGVVQDLRFGARGLRHRPVFAATAIVVLALGIGAPTTVFTLVDTIFFQRPEHVQEPHRLVRVFRSLEPGVAGGTLQHADYQYYRERATTLAGLAGYGGEGVVSYRVGSSPPGQLQLLHVSDNYFDVLGVPLVLGRGFSPQESQVPGRDAVAVVSEGFWTRALGGGVDALGSELVLNGIPFTVVGVAPEGFGGISPVEATPEVWVPLAMLGALNRIPADDAAWWERHPQYLSRWVDVVGRVADGVTLEAAEANLVALADALEHAHKGPQESVVVRRQFLYRPNQENALADLSRVLLGVVTLVLLVAAANVAVLLLSRATTRHREIGIRTAIGAGRGRIVRQLLTEAVLLGGIGGALGIGLAFLLSGAAGSFLPLPFHVDFQPDPQVLAAAAGLTLLTSVLVGLAPALHSAGRDLGAMVDDRSSSTRGTGARNALVVSQIALSLVLVAGALLFTRSFQAASSEDLGFDPESVLVAQFDLQSLGYDPQRGAAFLDEAMGSLQTLPSVGSVSVTDRIPFGGDWSTEIPAPEGSTPNAPDDRIVIGLNAVAPDYFEVMGIEMVAGRVLGPEDRADTEPVMVINETLAELLWPGLDPLGRIVPEFSRPYRVVGVARDGTYYELGEDPWTQAYLPVSQSYQSTGYFLVRSAGDAAGLSQPVQRALRELDPELAFGTVTTLEALVDEELARYEVSAVLVGLFGLIALLLATAGLYGVVAFTVSRRTREIGIRMALGADRSSVARGVLASGLRLAGLGIVLGLGGALALRGFTATLLYRVEPTDPLPLAMSCLALLAVTAAASWVPAQRATRVDPVSAIRAE